MMKRTARAILFSAAGVAAVVGIIGVAAAQSASSASTPKPAENESYYAPGAHVDLPPEEGPSPEEMKIFNEQSRESFRQLVKENPDVEMHNLND